MLKRNTVYILLLSGLLSFSSAQAQQEESEHRTDAKSAEPVSLYSHSIYQENASKSAEQVLELVQSSIVNKNLKALSPFFASKVYISLLSGKEGYYSAEQSFYILKDFFLNYAPVSFTFSNSNAASSNPYGVGTLRYVTRGKHGKAQLFVSLSKARNDWRISQITITDR
jgi:Domain of unknown function (DUF4783)